MAKNSSYVGPEPKVGHAYRIKTYNGEKLEHDFIAEVLLIKKVRKDYYRAKYKVSKRFNERSYFFSDIHECNLFNHWCFSKTEAVDVTSDLGKALFY